MLEEDFLQRGIGRKSYRSRVKGEGEGVAVEFTARGVGEGGGGNDRGLPAHPGEGGARGRGLRKRTVRPYLQNFVVPFIKMEMIQT